MSRSFNGKRARWAAMALDRFSHAAGEEDTRTLMLDLIADLGHLACARRLDFLGIAAQAVSTWAYERGDPEGLGPAPQVTIAIEGRRPRRAWRSGIADSAKELPRFPPDAASSRPSARASRRPFNNAKRKRS